MCIQTLANSVSWFRPTLPVSSSTARAIGGDARALVALPRPPRRSTHAAFASARLPCGPRRCRNPASSTRARLACAKTPSSDHGAALQARAAPSRSPHRSRNPDSSTHTTASPRLQWFACSTPTRWLACSTPVVTMAPCDKDNSVMLQVGLSMACLS